jgi:hypothetical protein
MSAGCRVVRFRPARAVPTHEPVLAGLRSDVDATLTALVAAETHLQECRTRLDRLQLLTAPARWELGPGWVCYIAPLQTDLYYRSRRCVGDSRGLDLGLPEHDDWRVWGTVFNEITPAIQHNAPFHLRIRRPSGEIVDGPTRISFPQYRQLRACARQRGLYSETDEGIDNK